MKRVIVAIIVAKYRRYSPTCWRELYVIYKAPSTPATMSKQCSTLSKQHSTSLLKTAIMSNEFFVKFRHGDKVETNWICSICFDFVERAKLRSTLLPKTATWFPKKGKNVEATFDFVKRIVRLVAFDNVALTLLLVWTGLKTRLGGVATGFYWSWSRYREVTGSTRG